MLVASNQIISMTPINLLFSESITSDMDEHDYELPTLNEEEAYDYPGRDDVMASEKVEITPNPAYGTVPMYVNSY